MAKTVRNDDGAFTNRMSFFQGIKTGARGVEFVVLGLKPRIVINRKERSPHLHARFLTKLSAHCASCWGKPVWLHGQIGFLLAATNVRLIQMSFPSLVIVSQRRAIE